MTLFYIKNLWSPICCGVGQTGFCAESVDGFFDRGVREDSILRVEPC